MQFKIYSCRLAILLAIISLLLIASKNVYAERETADHLVLFFNHPEISTEKASNEFNFKFFSNNSVFIGNQTQIKKFEGLLDNIIKGKIESKGIVSSIIIQIMFFDSEGYVKNLYIDRQKNFEYGKIRGRVPDIYFKGLVDRCMELVKIIDLRAQESFVWRTKVKELCGTDDIGPCR
jgi:hypothetical protein